MAGKHVLTLENMHKALFSADLACIVNASGAWYITTKALADAAELDEEDSLDITPLFAFTTWQELQAFVYGLAFATKR